MKHCRQMLFKTSLVLLAMMMSNVALAADSGGTTRRLIQVEGQLLSIQAIHTPIKTLLIQISQQSGIEIFVQGRAERNVTMKMHRVDLERGIKRLIAGQNHAFTYGYDERHDLMIQKLYIYSEREGDTMRRVAPSNTVQATHTARNHRENGIVIHPQSPNELDLLGSMQAIDPLMKLNQAQAPYLPRGFHPPGIEHGTPLGDSPR